MVGFRFFHMAEGPDGPDMVAFSDERSVICASSAAQANSVTGLSQHVIKRRRSLLGKSYRGIAFAAICQSPDDATMETGTLTQDVQVALGKRLRYFTWAWFTMTMYERSSPTASRKH